MITEPAVGGPRVLGVVGPTPQNVRARLIDDRTWSRHDVGDNDLMLLTRGRLAPWTAPSAHGIAWGAQTAVTGVSSWRDVAQNAVAAGVSLDPDGITLHSSAWGMEMLYTARLDNSSLAFATMIDDLLQIIDGPLDPDWDNWAAVLATNHAGEGRTPFLQIRRMTGGEHHRYDRRSAKFSTGRDLPVTTLDNQHPAATPGEVVDAMRMAIRDHPILTDRVHEPDEFFVSLPLTGGWDSRVIGLIAAGLYGPEALHALTTAKHYTGADPDITFGTRLGAAMRLTQELIFPEPSTVPEFSDRAFELLEHITWEHTWYQMAVDRLHQRGLPVLDGLAGDALMKTSVANVDILAATTLPMLEEAVSHKRLSLPPAGAPGATEEIIADLRERTVADVRTSLADLDGVHRAGRIAIMRTRISAVISVAPEKMLGSRLEIVTPFMHPEVTRLLLTVPDETKLGNDFPRAVVDAAWPGMSAISSTNDLLPDTVSGRRRTNSPQSRAWTERAMRVLAQHSSLDLQPDDLIHLHKRRYDRWRQRLVLLASWLEKYEHRLSSTTPPWWSA